MFLVSTANNRSRELQDEVRVISPELRPIAASNAGKGMCQASGRPRFNLGEGGPQN